MSDALTISEGRAAWQRIKDHTKASFDDWLTIGRALVVGKAQCLHQAGANRPYGPAYMRGMRAWLDSAGLGDIETQERRGAIFMAENETELVRWRSSLSAKEARHCNHPSTVVKHFQAGTRPQPRGPKTHNIVRPEHAAGDSSGYGKPIDWPRAEHIRRAAQAVGEPTAAATRSRSQQQR
jgi:hypothetical protein